MMQAVAIVSLVLMSSAEVVALTSVCQKTSWSLISSSISLENNIKTANLVQCLYMCKYVPNCQKVTYHVTRHMCSLNSDVNEKRTSGYALGKYQQLCEQMDMPGPCDDNPCQGEAQCLPLGRSYTCLDIFQCPKPEAPEHGNVIYDGTTVLSTRNFTCSDGYQLTGSALSKCRTDGKWDKEDPVCLVADCGVPSPEANATVQYTSTTYGSTATYTCGDGKTMSVTCGGNGEWTVRQDQCVSDVVNIDDWILIFRVTADINVSSYDIWTNNNTYHDYPANRKDVMPGCRTLNGSLPCDIHFKSKLVSDWDSLPISKVKVVMLNKGQEKAEIVFDGRGTDKENWFRQSKVTASTWTDMQSEDIKIFSIAGWVTRRFYINYYLGRCAIDEGWLAVLDKEPVCTSYRHETGPKIMYAPPPTKGYIESEYLHADVMAILIKLS